MSDEWIIRFWVYQPVFTAASILLWSIGVYFTIKTFREIKRQTDLQSQAFLVVAARKEDLTPDWEPRIHETARDLHRKWREILRSHVPQAIQKDKVVVLTFTNRGRADVIGWKITVQASVLPSQYLQENFNTRGERSRWTIDYQDHKDIVGPGEKIDIPLAITGCFPNAEFTWRITYTDTRNTSFDQCAGDTSMKDSNTLALHPPPSPPPAEPKEV